MKVELECGRGLPIRVPMIHSVRFVLTERSAQYRSVIYFANEAQKKAADAAAVRAKAEWPKPIVTEIAGLKEFYAAEAYHQNYFNLNKDRNPYCSVVIGPKLAKLVKRGVIKPE